MGRLVAHLAQRPVPRNRYLAKPLLVTVQRLGGLGG